MAMISHKSKFKLYKSKREYKIDDTWKKENEERIKARYRIWYELNKEKISAKNKERYQLRKKKIVVNNIKLISESQLKIFLGQMRQWLNEYRITDPNKMVTTEDLLTWFNIK